MQSEPTIFDYYDDNSPDATEFRRLARNIRYTGNPSTVKSVLVTSATKSEGKSLVSAKLAIAIAEAEDYKRVLLIDCDLRRPVIHSLFGVRRAPGFTSVDHWDSNPDELIRDTKLDGLKVIPSGPFVHSPSLWLASRAEEFLKRYRSQFDFIICDGPPVVPVDDPGILGPHLDGVLMVVLAGKTDRMVVKRAIEILNDAKANVLGVVLNNLHGTLPYYYDYKYYHYGYETRELPEESENTEEDS